MELRELAAAVQQMTLGDYLQLISETVEIIHEKEHLAYEDIFDTPLNQIEELVEKYYEDLLTERLRRAGEEMAHGFGEGITASW